MARSQGIKRLKTGFVRKLIKPELDGGYLFLSRDKTLVGVLNPDDFNVNIFGQKLEHCHLDRYGRFQVPTSLLKKLSVGQLMMFQLKEHKLRKYNTVEISAGKLQSE